VETEGGPADRRPLFERWRPTRLAELVGNPRARADLEAWANAWNAESPPARRAVLLVGPPGVGKTSAAVALAAERGWSLVEMNASEARNQSAIERVAGRASISHALDAVRPKGGVARTLVLLDEADCLTGGRTTEGPRPPREPVPLRGFLEGRYGSVEALNRAWGLAPGGKHKPFEAWTSLPRSPGNAGWAKLPVARRDLDDWRAAQRTEEKGDRGGLPTIARLVRATRQPIVLTVNDESPLHRYSPVFRSAVRTIYFGPIAPGELHDRLATIASSERVALGTGVLDAIVSRSNGDLRAALNDLEAVAALPPGPGQREIIGGRDLPSDFAAFTEELLHRARFYRSVEVRDRLDAPPDDLLPWVDENVPWFAPDPRHRDAAFSVVAAAELLIARARRWRVYGLWSYATELLSGGVSLAIRDAPSPSGGHAQFPRFLGAMGASRIARGVRDGLVRKLGRHLHLSRAKGRAIALPFLEAIFAEVGRGRGSELPRRLARELVAELGLTAEEVAALVGAPPDSAPVRDLLPADDAAAEENGTEPSKGPGGRGADGSGRPAVQRSLGDWGR
jgi:DNA polymerase III delta prime subunit